MPAMELSLTGYCAARCLDGADNRTARFRCVIALAWPDGRLETFEGQCTGVIALESKGINGFGFDPVFYLPELNCTMAELPLHVKNRISHRARAAALVRETKS
jgi:XTP/dITP diphosphohydrolase